MESLISYWGCGRIELDSRGSAGSFVTSKFSDISEKIIPFFEKYLIEGVKALDFSDFKRAFDIVKSKGHLTKEGLEQIRLIKSGMNRGRYP